MRTTDSQRRTVLTTARFNRALSDAVQWFLFGVLAAAGLALHIRGRT
jgi:cytochrome oxidase assembly protein ShyY1